MVSYIESAAGVEAGGRSGVTAIVTGMLLYFFLCSLPLIGAIPAAATAPALIIVGSLMMAHGAKIEWKKPAVAIPSFLTIIMIPLTFSIANGLAFGFVAYSLIKIGCGRGTAGSLARLYIGCAVYCEVYLYGSCEWLSSSGRWQDLETPRRAEASRFLTPLSDVIELLHEAPSCPARAHRRRSSGSVRAMDS